MAPPDIVYVPRRVYQTLLALLPDAPKCAAETPSEKVLPVTRALSRYREALILSPLR